MASQRTNQVGLGRMVTLRVDTCIMFAIEEPLETQSNVECYLVRNNNGETRLISMKAQSCALQLVDSF